MTTLTRFSAALILAVGLALGFTTITTSTASAQGQEEMNDAIQHLRQARESLSHAARDKGGHRENAMHIIDQAIAEVEAGKAYAKDHPEAKHHDHDHD